MKKWWVILVVVILGVWGWWSQRESPVGRENEPLQEKTPEITVVVEKEVMAPIDEFKERITKKKFGDYISPKNSPISPERFEGFHTGVDVEYGDSDQEIEVRSIAVGKVVGSRKAQGYGGVVIVEHQIGDQILFGIYGHLKPESMARVGEEVKAGQKIGVLGKDYSTETDNERKHLHLGLSKTNNIRGYVNNKAELDNWVDPLGLID